MKIYIYKENDISQFPSFKERNWIPKEEGDIEYTNDPIEADYIICPAALHRIKSKNMKLRVDGSLTKGIETLKYWTKYENKHVFFDCSDFENSYNGTSATLIRCNVRDFMLVDKNTIPWFWPVDDLKNYCDIPSEGFKYDVSFEGWLSNVWRKEAVQSCRNIIKNSNFKTYTNFYGLLNDANEQKRRMSSFLKSQQESRILLAPQSIPGVFPYRFYEAMSSARVPALFCSGYHLPFQNEIDWDKCTLRFSSKECNNAGKLIKKFLDNTTDEKIIEMGKYGREMWEKWLNRDKQEELVSYVLNKKLGK